MTATMRVPPHDLGSERALLGLVLLDRAVYDLARTIVASGDFYSATHGEMWEAYGRLFAAGEPIDQVTLHDLFEKRGRLAMIGGDEFLLSLTDRLADFENAEAYAKRIRDRAQQRRIILTLHELASRGYSPDVELDVYRSEVDSAIRTATLATTEAGTVHVREAMSEAIREIEIAQKAGGAGVTGRSFGIRDLDLRTTGANEGDLVIVAGRPGMGKTAFTSAGLMAIGKTGLPVLAFSLEMPTRQNAMRLMVAKAGIDLRTARSGRLTGDGWRDLTRAYAALNDFPIYLDDKTNTLSGLLSAARRFQARHGKVGAIFLDYLQLVRGDRSVPREQQISETTRELKALAKALACPVVALSQLNRECEKRPDKRPELGDLRESGAIEQDADIVLLLYRRGYYAAQMLRAPKKRGKWEEPSDIAPGEDDGITEIIIAKQRNGPAGVVKCKFLEPSAHFVDLAHDYGGSDEQRF